MKKAPPYHPTSPMEWNWDVIRGTAVAIKLKSYPSQPVSKKKPD